jgi:hypothetical protein
MPDNPLRGELYEELMDIYFAECASSALFQVKSRHYERDWVVGWYQNVLWPGNYYYELYKEDEDRELQATGSMTPGSTTIHMMVSNLGENWERYELTAKIFINWVSGPPTVTESYIGWIAPGETIAHEYTVSGTAIVGYKIEVSRYKSMRTFDMTPIPDMYTTNNIAVSASTTCGDLGGGVPPRFFNFDNKVDGKDLALFLLANKGKGPF